MRRVQRVRVGNGYDSHRLIEDENRPLIIGGVIIPSKLALQAHSDGDVVAHAVTDAILGACALGDIGEMFPDTDAANRGKDSIVMLQAAVARITAHGFAVGNVDITVITESPKIRPYRNEMRKTLAATLNVTIEEVSIKGKTNEGLGWIGAGEGIACFAVATVIPRGDEWNS